MNFIGIRFLNKEESHVRKIFPDVKIEILLRDLLKPNFLKWLFEILVNRLILKLVWSAMPLCIAAHRMKAMHSIHSKRFLKLKEFHFRNLSKIRTKMDLESFREKDLP